MRRTVEQLSDEFTHVDFSLVESNEDPLDKDYHDDEASRCQEVLEKLLDTEQNEIVCCSHGCILSTLFTAMGSHEYLLDRWWLKLLKEEHWEHVMAERAHEIDQYRIEEEEEEGEEEEPLEKERRRVKKRREELARLGREVRRRGYNFFFENCELKSGILFFIGEGWGEKGLKREMVEKAVNERRASFTASHSEQT
jgi:hypothetical protein